MLEAVPQEVFDQAVDLFHRLHQCPELGFELPKTTAIVEQTLRDLGIPFTREYGPGSIVGYIGQRKGVPTLGLRADMDALPVTEQVDVPHASRHPGVMHACGHDSHTAILLAAARLLKEREGELKCNVRLFFQPSEEGETSGGKMMTDNGCLEGVETVVAAHCEGVLPTGTLAAVRGDAMAACVPMTLTFHGLTSHATLPEKGIDAVAMGVEAYGALKEMVRREAEDRRYIWSVGVFRGGEVHNVIPDLCTQKISFRFFDLEFAERVRQKAQGILDGIALKYGGRAEMSWHMSCGPVINDPDLVDRFRDMVRRLPGVALGEVEVKNSSEDFSWFLAQKPGFLFRFGTYNEALGCTSVPHRPDFRVDEEAMKPAILAFVNFALEYGD